MKNSKSLIILLSALAVIITLGAVLTIVLPDYTEAEIAVISDLHIVADSYYTDYDTHLTYAHQDKMVHLSEAIAKSVVDEIIQNKRIKYVFVTGDMTEDGDYDSHLAAAAILRKLNQAGKKVFIVNGNHDAPSSADRFPTKVTAAQYREVYNDFGYKNAVAQDTMSLSYAADLNRKFRVIAIDNDNYFSTDSNGYKEEMDDRLINWVKEQLIISKSQKKTPLILSHKPLLNHLPAFIGQLLGEGLVNPEFSKLADTLLDNGANYVFTGHMHGMDIVSYTNSQGLTLYDIETPSTVYFPVSYRTVKFTRRTVDIRAFDVESINMDYVSSYNSAEDYDMIRDNFRGYAVKHMQEGLTLLRNISSDRIIPTLGLTGSFAEAAALVLDDAVNALLTTPLYDADDSGNLSIEKIVTENGGAMPQSEYNSVEDLIAFFIRTINYGDENIDANSIEITLLKCAIKSMFYFINDISDEIAEIFPTAPIINVNLVKLFSDGELEVIDSKLLAFVFSLIRDSLPSMLKNINLNNLSAIRLLAPTMITDPALADAIVSYIGFKEIYLDRIIDELIIGSLLSDALYDLGDRNIIISRK